MGDGLGRRPIFDGARRRNGCSRWGVVGKTDLPFVVQVVALRDQADDILGYSSLFECDESRLARVEFRSRCPDSFHNKQFVKSGLGQRDDPFVGEHVAGHDGGGVILSGHARDNQQNSR